MVLLKSRQNMVFVKNYFLQMKITNELSVIKTRSGIHYNLEIKERYDSNEYSITNTIPCESFIHSSFFYIPLNHRVRCTWEIPKINCKDVCVKC